MGVCVGQYPTQWVFVVGQCPIQWMLDVGLCPFQWMFAVGQCPICSPSFVFCCRCNGLLGLWAVVNDACVSFVGHWN